MFPIREKCQHFKNEIAAFVKAFHKLCAVKLIIVQTFTHRHIDISIVQISLDRPASGKTFGERHA